MGLDLDVDRTARYHTNALLLQVLNRPDSTAGDIRDFVLLQLRGALADPSEESEVLGVEAP
jgi:hypothetical protein